MSAAATAITWHGSYESRQRLHLKRLSSRGQIVLPVDLLSAVGQRMLHADIDHIFLMSAFSFAPLIML